MFKRICKFFGYTAVWVTVLIAALLLALYLLITNSEFITKVALPVVSIATGEEIEAERFEISPFRSRVNVRNLRLGDVDKPLLTVGTLETGYGFWLTVGGVTRLHDTVAGNINLYLDSSAAEPEETPSAPPRKLPNRLKLSLENLELNNLNIHLKQKNGSLALTNFSVKLDHLSERREGTLTANGAAAFQTGPDITVKSGGIQLESRFQFARATIPERLKLDLRLQSISGQIGKAPVGEQSLTVSANLSADKTDELILHHFSFEQSIGEEKISDITALGSFRAEDRAASLQITVAPLSAEIIRLASLYFTGIDPGDTQLFYKGALERQNDTVSSRGDLKLLRRGPLKALGQEFDIPQWNFISSHDLTFNHRRRDAAIRALSFSFLDKERETIGFQLNDGPLTVDLNAPPESAFGGENPGWTFFIRELALPVFNPLLGKWFIWFGADSAADVRIDGRLSAARGGFDLNAKVRGDRFFMRIDDVDIEYVPTEYSGTVRGNINPLNRMFIIDLASAKQSTARGDIGHAEVSGVWNLNTFVLTADVNAGGVGNDDVSQQAMIPNFVRDIIDHVMGKFFPAEYRFSGNAVLDLWNGFLRVPRGRLRMLQAGAEQTVDINDFYINWDKDTVMGPCTAVVRLRDFDTSQVNSWLPEGVPLRWSGLASGTVLYRMDGIATLMEADVDVSTNDLAVEFDGRSWNRLTLHPKFKISLTDYDRVQLDHMEINLKDASGGTADLTLAPASGSISVPAENPELNAGLVIQNIPLTEFNPLISDPEMQFKHGVLRSKLTGNFQKFGQYMRLQGDMALENFAVRNQNIHGEQFSLSSDFTLGLDQFSRLRVPMLIVRGSTAGHDMGSAAIQGGLELDSGNGRFTADIQQLNQEFYSVFDPGFLTGGTLRGKIDAELADRYRGITLNGDLELNHFQTTAMSESVSGRGHLNYRRDKDRFSSTGNTVNLEDLADFRWDFDGGVLNIASTRLDLLRLKHLFLQNGVPAKPGPRNEPSFDLSPFTAHLDLNGITFSAENNLRLTATIHGNGKELQIDPARLHVNETPITLRADARSSESGILYNLALSTENLDLDPVSTPLFEGSMKNLSGIAEKVDLKLSGRGLRYPAVWDHMNGSLTSSYRDISIPNNLQNTITGRLLFMPLRVVNEIRYQLGGIKNKQLGNAFSRIVSASDHMYFNTGAIDAEIHEGRVKLNNVKFTGDFIKQLKFTGDLGFGSDPQMLVHSTINVEEVMMPITIRGTVYDPEPDYAAAVVQFAAINTSSFLKSVFGIFSSGTLQDIIEEIHRTISGN
jgi:hypothetical protein